MGKDDFKELFFKVIENWEHNRILKICIANNDNELDRVYSRCENFHDRYMVSLHDALYHFIPELLSNAEYNYRVNNTLSCKKHHRI